MQPEGGVKPDEEKTEEHMCKFQNWEGVGFVCGEEEEEDQTKEDLDVVVLEVRIQPVQDILLTGRLLDSQKCFTRRLVLTGIDQMPIKSSESISTKFPLSKQSPGLYFQSGYLRNRRYL